MSTPFMLPDKLDTAAAASLHDALAAQSLGQVSLDGAQVRSCGALCAQVLLAARRDADARSAGFTLRPSAAMEDDLRLLGLGAELLSEGSDA
ncbi:hypothetical protein ROJ8625_01447 [Roseivivax jejudonensis]|uniref:MlaB-like STAS domain-containing protein n=1 Tax=Roseivivax jejudonensis TaxID=1529041 RepID=A0A1X6YUR2_9RHOB|nr:STAS domain-containing protein [Roseivivax jejudonensis]SLN31743.1 hypothetical protein ROJ8625_01447 [Roseivivax jejudonensis]